MSIRINKVTKEFNIGLQTVVGFLQKKGFSEVEANPNYKITEEQYNLIRTEFQKNKPQQPIISPNSENIKSVTEEDAKRAIFISYSRKDLEVVKVIKSEIDSAIGTKSWMDLEEIPADNDDYLNKIVEGIRNCKVFLFMLSKSSQESEHAIGELVAAKKQKEKTGIHVVILNIDDCEMNMKFTVRFATVNTIFWSDAPQRENLIKCLMQWLGTEKIKKDLMKPVVQHDDTESNIEVHINVDTDCNLFRFNTLVCHLKADEDNIIHMSPGKYKLEFVSSQVPEVKHSMVYSLTPGISYDYIEVSLKANVDKVIAERRAGQRKIIPEIQQQDIDALAMLKLKFMNNEV